MRQWCIRSRPDRPWPSERFAGTEPAGQRPVAARPFTSGRTSTTRFLANDLEVTMPCPTQATVAAAVICRCYLPLKTDAVICRWRLSLKTGAESCRGRWKLSLALPARLDLRPGVTKRDGTVEDGSFGGRVGIDAEIAQTLELHPFARLEHCETRFELRIDHHLD